MGQCSSWSFTCFSKKLLVSMDIPCDSEITLGSGGSTCNPQFNLPIYLPSLRESADLKSKLQHLMKPIKGFGIRPTRPKPPRHAHHLECSGWRLCTLWRCHGSGLARQKPQKHHINHQMNRLCSQVLRKKKSFDICIVRSRVWLCGWWLGESVVLVPLPWQCIP